MDAKRLAGSLLEASPDHADEINELIEVYSGDDDMEDNRVYVDSVKLLNELAK